MIGRSDFIGIDMSGVCWRASHIVKSPFGTEPAAAFRLEGSHQDMAGQLKEYVQRLRSGSPSIALAMPQKNCLTKVLRMPAADRSAAARMLGFELERHLPSEANQWRWSVDLLEADASVSTVMFTAVKTRDVEDITKMFNEAGLSLALVTSGQAAFIEAIRRSGFIAASELTGVVSVDENAFALAVVKDGMLLYSAEAPLRGLRQEMGFAVSFLRMSPHVFVIIDEGAPEDAIDSVSEIAREFSAVTKVFGPVPALSRSFGAAVMAEENAFASDFMQHEDVLPARGKALAAAGAAMLALLAVGAGVVLNDVLALRNLENEIASLGEERIKAQSVMRQAGAIKSDLKTIEDMKGASSFEFLQMLGRLTELTPEDTYFTGLEYGKDRIIVDGVSGKASGLFMKLSHSGFAGDITYDGPVTRAKDGKERFRIKFRQTGGEGNEDTRTGS